MRFKLTFTTGNPQLGLFDNFHQIDGLDLSELVEETLGWKVPINKISHSCNLDLRAHELTFFIDGVDEKGNTKWEKIIQNYPIFKHREEATVIVSPGWFGQFVEQVVKDKYYEPSQYDLMPEWKFLFFHFGKWAMFNKKAMATATRIHLAAMDAHKSGAVPFKLDHVTVTNEYKGFDVINGWFEAGMPDYWGIDEERHVEMVLREMACKEEFERQKKIENRQEEIDKLKTNAVSIENFVQDIELIASRLRSALGKKAKVDILAVKS